MSRSPDRLRQSVAAEVRRIGYESPTRYDADFYIRKINRLQNDMNMLQDELSGARVRLRRAEDFELKFQLATRQNSQLTLELDRLNKENQGLAVEVDRLRLALHEEAAKTEHPDVDRLRKEADYWKKKCEQTEQDSLQRLERLGTLTAEANGNRELQQVKRDKAEQQERYENEIRQLNRLLAEKDTIDKFVGAKVERIRTEKDKEILRLNGIIDKQKQELEAVVREKNEELYRLRERYEKIVNLELQNIHSNLATQDEVFNVELAGLRAMISAKNDEIGALLKRIQNLIAQTNNQKDQLKRQIKALTQALYKAQRESELQTYNIRQRLTAIHAKEIKQLQQKHQNHMSILKQNKSQIQKLLGLKQEQLRNKQKQMDRQAQAFKKKLDHKDQQLRGLGQRLAHHGQTNIKQLNSLHQSLHKITSQKQQVASGYLQNISFLDQQIKRLTTTLELRNVEIKNLETSLADTRRRCDELVRDAERKWKAERKDREQERERLREEKEQLEEDARAKENQWRLKEKLYLSVKEKDGVEIDRLNCLVTELQKDVNRLNSYIKQLDQLLKKQTRKSQLTTLDTGGVRRQLTAELDRQANELDNLKRMQLEQLRKKFELDIERLENDNRRLKAELTNKTLAMEGLEEEFRKVEGNNRALERINREKMVDYQRRMATLNSEIFLTQNLYQSFMEAKTRLKKEMSSST